MITHQNIVESSSINSGDFVVKSESVEDLVNTGHADRESQITENSNFAGSNHEEETGKSVKKRKVLRKKSKEGVVQPLRSRLRSRDPKVDNVKEKA